MVLEVFVPRVQVILSEVLDERFTAYCEAKGHKKSTLAARLIKDHLDRESFAVQAPLPLSGRPQDPTPDTQAREG